MKEPSASFRSAELRVGLRGWRVRPSDGRARRTAQVPSGVSRAVIPGVSTGTQEGTPIASSAAAGAGSWSAGRLAPPISVWSRRPSRISTQQVRGKGGCLDGRGGPRQVGPVDRVDRPRPEVARPLEDLQISREAARLRDLAFDSLVVLGVEADDPMRPVVEVEHERHIERAEASEVAAIETARRVREADVAHGARRVRPPGVDGPVGEPEVGGQVAEEVAGHRRRRQQVGPRQVAVRSAANRWGARWPHATAPGGSAASDGIRSSPVARHWSLDRPDPRQADEGGPSQAALTWSSRSSRELAPVVDIQRNRSEPPSTLPTPSAPTGGVGLPEVRPHGAD